MVSHSRARLNAGAVISAVVVLRVAAHALSHAGVQEYAGLHPFEQPSRSSNAARGSHSRGLDASSAWKPIRIVPHFVDADIQLEGASLSFLRDKLLPAALLHYERALRVVPVSGPLFASRCKNRFYFENGKASECASTYAQPRCGGTSGPLYDPAHMREERVCSGCQSDGEKITCSGCRMSFCPSETGCEGVHNADYVLYVTAKNRSSCESSTIATAIVCERDQYDRPTFGNANFCPQRVVADPAKWGDQLSTAIHEIAHALGFSEDSFAYMRDIDSVNPPGQPRTPRDRFHRPIPDPNFRCMSGREAVDERPPAATTLKVVSEGAVVRKMLIVTPRVRREARNHFDCSTLEGAEIESQPTAPGACWGSHWEERLFMSDALSAVASGTYHKNINSRLTLAYFEDTGWYKADYTYAQTAHWGYKAGCAFATSSCISGGASVSPSHFCTIPQRRMCIVGRNARGLCQIAQYSGLLPPRMQYFTNGSLGGTMQELDYCPIVSPYSNGDCREPANQDSQSSLYGEVHSSASRCFESSLLEKGYTINGNLRPLGTSCYEHRCNADGTLDIKIVPASGATTWLSCPATSDASNRDKEVAGFSGAVRCPLNVATELCLPEYRGCLNQCNGFGACVRGECVCEPGFAGADCSLTDHCGVPPAQSADTTHAVKYKTGVGGVSATTWMATNCHSYAYRAALAQHVAVDERAISIADVLNEEKRRLNVVSLSEASVTFTVRISANGKGIANAILRRVNAMYGNSTATRAFQATLREHFNTHNATVNDAAFHSFNVTAVTQQAVLEEMPANTESGADNTLTPENLLSQAKNWITTPTGLAVVGGLAALLLLFFLRPWRRRVRPRSAPQAGGPHSARGGVPPNPMVGSGRGPGMHPSYAFVPGAPPVAASQLQMRMQGGGGDAALQQALAASRVPDAATVADDARLHEALQASARQQQAEHQDDARLRQALQASARQQELDDARDAQLQEALRVSRREQGQVPHGSAVVVHRGAARAGYEI